MSRYGIADFYNTATQYGFARTNLFRINEITNNIYIPDDSQDLFLYMRTGIIPQRKISSQQVNFKAFTYNIPMKVEYPESNGSWIVEFFCDSKYGLRDIFEKWSVGTYDEHSSTSQDALQWWNSDIQLSLLNNSSNESTQLTELTPVKNYTLKGAFPANLGSMNYKTEDKGEIASMQVSLGFQYLISETVS